MSKGEDSVDTSKEAKKRVLIKFGHLRGLPFFFLRPDSAAWSFVGLSGDLVDQVRRDYLACWNYGIVQAMALFHA